MSLDPWARCEVYVECECALDLNGYQTLFECGHGRYWYLGNRVLPQVHHVYPPTTIQVPPCPSIWLVDLLTDKEIAQAHAGYIIPGIVGTYSEFVQTHLQGSIF
ncbi:hypothetical protein ACB092_11G085000 [Castanea dentata]